MKKLTTLSLAVLLMGAAFTSCNNGAEKKDAPADSLTTKMDTSKPKVDTPVNKVDSGSALKPIDTTKKVDGHKKEVVGTKHL